MGENKNSGKQKKVKFEDVTSYSRPDDVKGSFSHFFRYKFKPFFLKNKKRNLKVILSLFICLVLAGTASLGVYLQKMLLLIDYDPGNIGNPDATFADLEENVSYESMHDITDANSLRDLLRSWALNGGEKLKSKNVVNVLLLGCDSEGGSSRSDTMILVSVNKKTQTISLVSFLRDSYTYMNIGGSERFDKTNHSYVWGGPAVVIETLENNYKIEIDSYVSIDFSSFIAVINELGGVRVAVTDAEARYMNRTTHFDDFQSGESVLLDGEHALIYSRIRHLDGEVERTDRQRKVITSIIQSTMGSNMSMLNDALTTFLPYVKTNLRQSEIISLGTQAISQKWMNYKIVSVVQPSENFRREAYTQTWSSNNLFVWVIDYPMAARELQNTLYGTTNIQIDEATHNSAFSLLSAEYSPTYESDDNQYDDDTDDSDDEDTTTKWYDRYNPDLSYEDETEPVTEEETTLSQEIPQWNDLEQTTGEDEQDLQ